MRILIASALTLALSSGLASAEGYQAGFSVGPTWAMSGESPITFNEFKADFNTGYGISGWVSGSLSGMFGWRGEFGYDRMPADGDPVAGVVAGDYPITRFMGGVQIAPFETEGSGIPYFFFVVGGAHEDFSISGDGVSLDVNGQTKFGMSFGGGYNWLIGESWGVGGDLHINAGFFEDDTRWWWTPSGQVFFRF